MAFYVGKWLAEEDPGYDRDNWSLPSLPDQHIKETSNVEDLNVNPEDIDIIPEQIQFGQDQWTDEESIDSGVYKEFYPPAINFYIRSFTPGTNLYKGFYPPIPNFYIRSFTPGIDLYKEFYPPAIDFYVRSFTPGINLYKEFYAPAIDFYVRNFTPTDFFYSLPDGC